MMRTLWLACCVLVPAVVLAVPTLAIAGIWTGIGRLLATSGVLLMCSVPVVPLFWIWTEERRPDRPLPRRVRRALRMEKARIALEAEIARAEREAGIR